MYDGNECSLGSVIACLESGCPTIVVNVRSWPSGVKLPDAMAVYQDFLEKLDGKWDLLDCMVTCLFFRALENSRADIEDQSYVSRKNRKTATLIKMDIAPAKWRNWSIGFRVFTLHRR